MDFFPLIYQIKLSFCKHSLFTLANDIVAVEFAYEDDYATWYHVFMANQIEEATAILRKNMPFDMCKWDRFNNIIYLPKTGNTTYHLFLYYKNPFDVSLLHVNVEIK